MAISCNLVLNKLVIPARASKSLYVEAWYDLRRLVQRPLSSPLARQKCHTKSQYVRCGRIVNDCKWYKWRWNEVFRSLYIGLQYIILLVFVQTWDICFSGELRHGSSLHAGFHDLILFFSSIFLHFNLRPLCLRPGVNLIKLLHV